jgi:hypothetical protein
MLPILLLLFAAPALAAVPGLTSVLDHGAVGDGVTDNTAAFQKAMDAIHADGGGIVSVPTGRYRFQGTLRVPARVTLEGVWRSPVRGEPFGADGSVLLVTAGQGDPDGPPFLRMGESSTLKGLTIFYPEQVRANPPTPYPWTVQTEPKGSDNVGIHDVTMVNPYQAVDFGTHPAGRHTVNNLHGYPLLNGIYVNQCYDVGRLENVHFWPFWDLDPNSPLWAFTKEKGRAFILGKTDGEMGHNLFSIFYSIGMHFIAGPVYDAEGNLQFNAAGSGMYTNCYMDVSPCAIRVDNVMPNAGVTFVNASIMANVVVGPTNQGPVTFTSCGFWATPELAAHATLEGRGTVTFSACHFTDWDKQEAGVPCIDANNQRLILTACDFPTHREDHQILRLGPRIRSAIVTSNAMPRGQHIQNNAPPTADVQIALNTSETLPSFITEWIVIGDFPNPKVPPATPGAPDQLGYVTDYLHAMGGETQAVLTLDTQVVYEENGAQHTAKAARQRTNFKHFVNLHDRYKPKERVAYAQVYVHSDKDQEAYLDFGFNDNPKVWVNGELVYERFNAAGFQCVPGGDPVRATLKPGPNRLLLKIADGGGRAWEFTAEAYGEDGLPLRATIAP